MQTRDKEINKILNRAEEYRKQFQKSETKVIKPRFDIDFEEIFKVFFSKVDSTNENNVFIKYKISKKDIKNGIIKNLKYKVMDKENKKITKTIDVKLPQKLPKKQKIVIAECGNYISKKNRYSNLVITLINKNGGKNENRI